MKSIQEIRRDNINHLIDKISDKGKKNIFAEMVNYAPAYISQLSLGTSPMGEKTARKIEKNYPLPKGWMDAPREQSTEKTHAHKNKQPLLSLKESQLLQGFKKLSPADKKRATDFIDGLLQTSTVHAPDAKGNIPKVTNQGQKLKERK